MIDFGNTLLLGHRGARSEALENTWFGFEHASNLQAKGLSGVEFDVQLTADGYLMVFHDDDLRRLCGLQARVNQLNLSEIQRNLQSGHKIITLDALAPPLPLSSSQSRSHPPRPSILESFTHIELEIKTHERTNYAQMLQALTHYLIGTPLSRLPIVLTSFDRQLHAHLQRSPQLAHIPRGLLIRDPRDLKSAPNSALQLGCRQLGLYYPLIDQAVLQNCRRYQLPVSAWTVNDPDAIKQLITWQVDVIITDIPMQLLK